MLNSMCGLPFTATEFVSACEILKELPFQNGDEDWVVLQSMLKRLYHEKIDLLVYLTGCVSVELLQSPLFEILLGTTTPTKAPSRFRAVEPGGNLGHNQGAKEKFVRVDFTAMQFLAVCCQMDSELDHNGTPGSWYIFSDMIRTLTKLRVNILDFLSFEDTDDMLQICGLLRLVLHTTFLNGGHVTVDHSIIRHAILKFDGYATKRHVPPYPPSPFGLDFNQTQFLKSMEEAEEDTALFEFPSFDTVPSFRGLHMRLHDLHGLGENISVASFMAGQEPEEGTSGSIIFKHLLASGDSVLFNCWLFFAHVASNGDGHAFLTNYYTTMNAQYRLRKTRLTHEEATNLVDALPKVDVSTISRNDMRCPHCWGDFDKVEEGVNNEPVQLPCDHRHLIGRDCLVQGLKLTGPLCPLCRVDIVALSRQRTLTAGVP